jgi:hypothetical protein
LLKWLLGDSAREKGDTGREGAAADGVNILQPGCMGHAARHGGAQMHSP